MNLGRCWEGLGWDGVRRIRMDACVGVAVGQPEGGVGEVGCTCKWYSSMLAVASRGAVCVSLVTDTPELGAVPRKIVSPRGVVWCGLPGCAPWVYPGTPYPRPHMDEWTRGHHGPQMPVAGAVIGMCMLPQVQQAEGGGMGATRVAEPRCSASVPCAGPAWPCGCCWVGITGMNPLVLLKNCMRHCITGAACPLSCAWLSGERGTPPSSLHD